MVLSVMACTIPRARLEDDECKGAGRVVSFLSDLNNFLGDYFLDVEVRETLVEQTGQDVRRIVGDLMDRTLMSFKQIGSKASLDETLVARLKANLTCSISDGFTSESCLHLANTVEALKVLRMTSLHRAKAACTK